MRFAQFVSLCALASRALALATGGGFEPTNFNVTEALIANGVDPGFIPDAEVLSKRSSLGACKIAVCWTVVSVSCAAPMLTGITVQFLGSHLWEWGVAC